MLSPAALYTASTRACAPAGTAAEYRTSSPRACACSAPARAGEAANRLTPATAQKTEALRRRVQRCMVSPGGLEDGILPTCRPGDAKRFTASGLQVHAVSGE